MSPCPLVCVLLASLMWAPPMRASEFRGGTLPAGTSTVYAWGDGLWRVDLPSLQRTRIATGWFGEGGCTYDIDGDGVLDVVLQEGEGLGKLVWIGGRDGKRHVIDSGIEMHDCLVTSLLGRTGVLMIQRGMQVRFYSFPPAPGGDWGYREIYSFYTPSYQTSLILTDVDQDGFPDILCGNYWMKSPERFELPWHIYAIDTYSETPKSAMLRIALLDPRHVVVAQGHMQDARLTLFEKPADPRKMWDEHRLEDDLHLANPHGLLPWGDGFLLGENNGANSRLYRFAADGAGFRPSEVSRGQPVLAMWRWKDALVMLGPDKVKVLDSIPGTKALR